MVIISAAPKRARPLLSRLEGIITERGTVCCRLRKGNLLTVTDDAADSAVVWGAKRSQRWYRSTEKNILFVENGLFCQRAGMYVDTLGWFDASGIVQRREYDQEPAGYEPGVINDLARDCFGWYSFFSTYDPGGPILFALQRPGDASVRYQRTLPQGSYRQLEAAFQLVSAHFGDDRVLVRPHPSSHAALQDVLPKLERCFGTRWEIDGSDDVYDTISRCKALITISSTVATEALWTGIPVATLGRSTYSGAGVTLECAGYPHNLGRLLSFKPDPEAVRRYLAAVIRHQIPYGASCAEIVASESVKKWLSVIDPDARVITSTRP